jgi:hypothetical protein
MGSGFYLLLLIPEYLTLYITSLNIPIYLKSKETQIAVSVGNKLVFGKRSKTISHEWRMRIRLLCNWRRI